MQHRLRQHMDPITTVLVSLTVIGLAFTVGCITMMRAESDWSAPWHLGLGPGSWTLGGVRLLTGG